MLFAADEFLPSLISSQTNQTLTSNELSQYVLGRCIIEKREGEGGGGAGTGAFATIGNFTYNNLSTSRNKNFAVTVARPIS